MARHEELTLGKAYVESLEYTEQGVLKAQGDFQAIPFFHKATLADDGTYGLPDATEGFVLVTNATESIVAHISTDGSVVGISSTTNTSVGSGDSDGNLVLKTDGTTAIIKNMLGQEEDITILYFYAG